MAYLIEVNGTPQLKLRADVLPADFSLPMEELVATGFIITAMPVVKAMLDMANVGPADIVYDLGSGDGRLQDQVVTDPVWTAAVREGELLVIRDWWGRVRDVTVVGP